MLYLNSMREEIKSKNPDIKVTEIAKKGGEMWKELKDKSKWEKKAGELKEQYNKAMEEYKASGGGKPKESKEPKEKGSKKKKETKNESPSKATTGGSYKSKEYISDDDSSSDDDDDSKSKTV